MKFIFSIFLIIYSSTLLQAQSNKDSISDNISYLEDQLYLALAYNNLSNTPVEVSQNGFSGSVALGFIKDIPLNSNGSFGIALGIGYQYNAYIQNLKISNETDNTVFSIAEDYKTNWLKLHAVDMPFEIRWRTSTIDTYKFWRVYTGVKASYIFASKSKFRDDDSTIAIKDLSELRKIQFGLTLAVGYSTWNLYLYYGLNSIFENAYLNNSEQINFRDFKVGLKFYIM
ncbi:PorT family protein [Lutibacter sp. A80]|uniref:porin family protein n=1 Tax=Lutibacter sp. A80 TaxID=2918453 RepID=UPI001F05734C|nr:porin family protein [Lutibacter sp. A80]UMB60015.1 PorT family protein [Lutibacter sp. A80]